MVCVVFGAETERASPLFFISADRHHRALKHNEDEDHETDNDGGPFGRHTEVRGERIEDGADQRAEHGAEHVPKPPVMIVPPMTTEATASSSQPTPTVFLAEPMFAVYTIEARAARVAEVK